MAENEEKKPIFRDLAADDEPQTTEIESLCMNCNENVSKLVCISINLRLYIQFSLSVVHVIIDLLNVHVS